MSIHPTAIVDPSTELGADVSIGPYTVVEAGVRLGDRCRIGPHSHLKGPLVLGEECDVGFSVSLGHDPQVAGNRGPFGGVCIGRRNVFREFSQVHRSMKADGETRIGDDNYFMAGSHVAHDCRLGSHITLCNSVLLAGHVEVGDRAFLAGLSAAHQFSRIGELAMVGGRASVPRDAPPYGMVVGSRPTRVRGLNVVGLRRAGVSAEVRRALQEAYRVLFRSSLMLPERLEAVDRSTPEVARLVEFIEASRRGVIGFGGSATDE